MTSLRAVLEAVGSQFGDTPDGGPPDAIVVAPRDGAEAARLLDLAAEHRRTVLPWGGGVHQGFGGRITPDIVLRTDRLSSGLDWRPDDLTVVVDAGVTVAHLEQTLSERRQTSLLPVAGGNTVGGTIAAGVSGYTRGRYGPARDRVLEVTLATGDGRLVRAGGQVVKNVSGYDIPKLAAGSLGGLGLITSVCLKLWPLPAAEATVAVSDPVRASAALHRPLAVLEIDGLSRAYVNGTREEVEAQASLVGELLEDAIDWPPPPFGRVSCQVRIAPALVPDAVGRLPDGIRYVAQHGVGVIDTAGDWAPSVLIALREWVESCGGRLVLTDGPTAIYDELDPWGSPPADIKLQRRVKAAFDPLGIMVPGRLPGRL